MGDMTTAAVFPNSMDVRINLFKDMLEQAGIDFIVINEHGRIIDGIFSPVAGNIGIEIRVRNEDLHLAAEIYDSIK
jgi:hypothetical protein